MCGGVRVCVCGGQGSMRGLEKYVGGLAKDEGGR